MTLEKKAGYFNSLEALRGIAASLVVLYHLSAAGYFYNFPLVRHGEIAVPLFFVLSGFVITHASQNRLNDGAGFRSYMIRRFGRVYPLHFICLALVFALEIAKAVMMKGGATAGDPAFTGPTSYPALAANLFLIQAVLPFKEPTWNGPSWSISTEFYTYIIFGVLMVTARSRQVLASIVILLVSGVCLTVAQQNHLHVTEGSGLAMCVFGFFAGSLTYRLRAQVRFGRWASVAELIAAAAMVSVFWVGPESRLLQLIIFPACILVFSFDAGIVSRGLMSRIPMLLGTLSFSMYLLHFPILSLLNSSARFLQSKLHVPLRQTIDGTDMISFGPTIAMDALAAVYFLLVVVAAYFTYRIVEVPARDFFNRLASARRKQIVEAN